MIRLVLLRAVFVVAWALPAAAQDLPDWNHTSINDLAGLLTDEDTQVLDQALIALHDETGVEGTVVTLEDRVRYGGADGLEPFATRLFNHWGVGDARRNDGFMVLVLKGDREARIELGSGYGPEADRVAQTILDRTMLPDFRGGRMSHAIREGTLDVIQHIARPAAAGQPASAPKARRDPIGRLVPLAVLAVFALVGWRFLRSLLGMVRNRRQPCPGCGGAGIIEQSETITDTLPGGTDTTRQVVWQRCPTCGSTGPRSVPRPVSSGYRGGGRGGGSGGGFGGGRSSGGGASGRW